MSEIGSWDPGAETPQGPDLEFLRECLRRFEGCAPEQLSERFHSAERRRHAGMMRCAHEAWRALAEQFSDEELRQLIRFLTLAEAHFADWRADEHSPVIPLARALRSRGQELDREFLLWIRAHSKNRYLPYGPAIPE